MAGASFAVELLEAIESSSPRLACMHLIAKYAGCTVYIPAQSKAAHRAHAATHMLANGMDGGEAVRALRKRFLISERTAWTDVAEARRKIAEGNCATG